MAVTTEEFKNGTGSATEFSFAFPYLKEADVKVATYASDTWTETTAFTFKTATTIKFNSAPASGTGNIRIFRDTEVDTAKGIYSAGSTIRAQDLNDNQDQVLYALQEEQSNLITNSQLGTNSVKSANIVDGTIVNADVNASAAIAGTKVSPDFGSQAVVTTGTLAAGATTVTGNITVSGTVDGRDLQTDGTKLDAIEASATADQTNAEIRAAVEAASDSNVFTDADHSKLNAIEASATADQTDAEIRAAVEAATDSNVFTDADHTKLDGIAAGAEVNVQSDWNSTSGDNQILNKPSLDKALNDLTDVNTSGAVDGKILKHNGTSWVIGDDASGSGGSSTFTGLTDTPANFSGAGGKTLAVKDDASGVEFVTAASAITVQNDGSDLNTAATTLNFTGDGVTASGTGATKTISVSSGGGNTSTDFKYLELRNAANNGAASYPASDFTLVTAGTTTALTPAQANALIVSYGGVIQQPNTGTGTPTTGFAISGSTIKFGSAIAAAPDFIIYLQGAGVASIAANSVSGDKIALGSDASGDIMYYNGTDYVRLAKGDDGKVLKLASGVPSWGDAAAGVGGATGVDFDDGVKARFGTDNDGEISYNEGSDKLEIGTTTAGSAVRLSGKVALDFDIDGGQRLLISDAVGAEFRDDITILKTSGGGTVKLREQSSNGSAYIGLACPTDKGSDASYTITLPSAAPASNGLALTATTAGVASWTSVSSSVASGCIYENSQTINENHTIASGKGAHSVGPIQVNATVTVNGNWVVS